MEDYRKSYRIVKNKLNSLFLERLGIRVVLGFRE